MGDEAGTSSWPGAALNTNDPDRLPVHLEIDLGVRQQARAFADVHRDGDLPFRCYPHFVPAYSYSYR